MHALRQSWLNVVTHPHPFTIKYYSSHHFFPLLPLTLTQFLVPERCEHYCFSAPYSTTSSGEYVTKVSRSATKTPSFRYRRQKLIVYADGTRPKTVCAIFTVYRWQSCCVVACRLQCRPLDTPNAQSSVG